MTIRDRAAGIFPYVLLISPFFLFGRLSWKDMAVFGILALLLFCSRKFLSLQRLFLWVSFIYILYLIYRLPLLYFPIIILIVWLYFKARPFLNRDKRIVLYSAYAVLGITGFYGVVTGIPAGNGLKKLILLLIFYMAAVLLYNASVNEQDHKRVSFVVILFCILFMGGIGKIPVSEYFMNRGVAAIKNGDIENGSRMLKRSYEINRYNYKAYLKLAGSYIDGNRFKDAIKTLQEFYRVYPYTGKSELEKYAAIFADTGNYNGLIEHRLGVAEGLDFMHCYKTAEFFRKNFYMERAVLQMEKATPKNRSQLKLVGEFWLMMGFFERAKNSFNKIAEKDNNIRQLLSYSNEHISHFREYSKFNIFREKGRVYIVGKGNSWRPESKDWPGGDNGWDMVSEGISYQSISLADGTQKLYVEARGSGAGGIWPIAEILIGNRSYSRVYVSSAENQYFSVDVSGLEPGIYNLRIKYLNDYWDMKTGEDRNLYLGTVYGMVT